MKIRKRRRYSTQCMTRCCWIFVVLLFLIGGNLTSRIPYDVILSAYMNSGSTFTGRMLGHRRDAFYVYEPLWRMTLWGYYSNNTVCNTRHKSCSTSTAMIENRIKSVSGRPTENNILSPDDIREIESPISVPIRVLDHVINCRLRAVRTFLEPGVTEALKFAGPSWSDYWYCNQMGQPWDTCLNVLEGSCQQAQHVVAKVLRLSVGAYWTLLFRNNNLKVVHLFRDPRGVVNSRLNTRGYALKKTIENVKTNAEALCDKMWSDLQEGKRLMGKFPDRFKFVHYEKLVYLDKEVIELHDFLGLRLTRANLEIIRRDYTNVLWKWRENRQNNAFWWRTSLPWELIKAVDNACGDVLEELGYPVFENFEHMQNMNYTDILYGLKY